ncbi:MAG: amidohydrolase [Actinomycetota bacterium]
MPPGPRRLLVTAGTIHAGDPPRPGPTAMLIDGGRIAWTGHADSLPGPIPRARVDIGGAVVIPGLVDCHFHMLCLLPTAGWADLRGVRSIAEVRRMLAMHAPRVPDGRWLVGWGFDAANANGRHVRRDDLDAVSPDRPTLVIESSLHQGTVNSAALSVLGWGRSTPRWYGGAMARDHRGEPTGLVWERAFGVPALRAVQADLEGATNVIAERLRSTATDLLAQGVTHVAEAFTPPVLADAFGSTPLPLGLTMMPTSNRGIYSSPYDVLDGPKTGDGDAGLGVGHLKLISDGAERAAMCLSMPQAMRTTALTLWRALRTRDVRGVRVLSALGTRFDGGRVRSGTPHYRRHELADIATAALRSGFRIAIHALGNDALDTTLDAFERAREVTGIDVAGCRIEHAMFGRPRDFERAARLGLILSMQPSHAAHYAPTLRLTAMDTIFQAVPLRWAMEAGCRLAISSDGPTVSASLLENVRTAVDRIGIEGAPVAAGQAIARDDALRAATVGGAEACGVDDLKGSIDVGKQADFVVMSGDPFDPSARVLETWIAGVRVWSSDAA